MKPPKNRFFRLILQWGAVLLIAVLGWMSLSPPSPPPTKSKIIARAHIEKTESHYEEHLVSPMYEETVAAPQEERDPENTAPQPADLALPKRFDGKPPQISIIIDDVGLDARGTQRAIELPSFITLSLLPYAPRLRDVARDARDHGHELMLHMPMEPVGRNNPGPNALLVDLSPDEIQQRVIDNLSSFTGYNGINNHMGSKFTADRTGMGIVFDALEARGLFFVDSRTTAKSVAEAMARERGIPTIGRDVFLDDTMNATMVRQQLAQTERIALRKGHAVAIGHPHAVTLHEIEQWLPQAAARGFEFMPIKNVVMP